MNKVEYDKIFSLEENYWWYKGVHQLIQRICKKYKYKEKQEDVKKPTLLDAGCGTGRLLQMLSETFDVHGFDHSLEAIGYSKKRDLINLFQQDINLWDPVPESYDIITSIDVICCKGIDKDENILKKFHRGLKKKGILILNLPSFNILKRDHDIAVSIGRRYRIAEFKKTLANADFEPIIITYRLPLLFLYILLSKPLSILENKHREIVSDLRPLPGILNKILFAYHILENRIIQQGVFIPFGSSMFVVAGKKGSKKGPD